MLKMKLKIIQGLNYKDVSLDLVIFFISMEICCAGNLRDRGQDASQGRK